MIVAYNAEELLQVSLSIEVPCHLMKLGIMVSSFQELITQLISDKSSQNLLETYE